MKKAYLDNASTTPIRNEVLKKMIDASKYIFGNPSSSQHSYGRNARSAIEEARIKIASCINSSPHEIIFTSGGTESNNLILRNAINLGVNRIFTSKLEHLSVLETISYLNKKKNIKVNFIFFDKKGVIDLYHIENLFKKYYSDKILVSLMTVNNEIGNILEYKSISYLCKKYNAYFHSDTIQFIGNYPIDIKKYYFDFITASSHKIYGPKGVGFVFIRNNLLKKITPFIIGGNQEYGIRSGTENTIGIIAMAESLKLSYNNFSICMKKIKKLKRYCISQLKKIDSSIIFNGLSDCFENSSPYILNFFFPVKKIDYLLYFYLDLMGVSVSKGSSCNSSINKISHVIQSITKKKSILKKMMPIRISFGIFNEKKDIDLLIKSLKKIRKDELL